MFDREALHRLVDGLPDDALDVTFRVLEHYQKHPPKSEANPEKLCSRACNRVLRSAKNRAKRTGLSTSLFGGCIGPDGYGSASAQGWEGQTCLISKVYFYRGSELRTAERLSISDVGELSYSVEAKLEGGSARQHEFGCRNNSSAGLGDE